MSSITYIGLDVHTTNYTICSFNGYDGKYFGEVTVKPEYQQIEKYVNRLKKQYEPGHRFLCGYEAGYLGYSLYHELASVGIECVILAPSTMCDTKTNRQIKTDPRDARNIADCLAYGLYSAVHVPTEQDDAVKEYMRMRDSAAAEFKAIKQQILAFCVRHGKRFEGKSTWTRKHLDWLDKLDFGNPILQNAFWEYLRRYYHAQEMQDIYDTQIAEYAQMEEYRQKVSELRCLIGIETHTALALITEVSDFRRFGKADQFAAYLGLIPGEHSSAEKTKRLGITKTGNKHLRRLLVEAAQHYGRGAVGRKSVSLKKKQEGNRREVIAYADRCNTRLKRKFYRIASHSPRNVAKTAAARELACFVWGIMTEHIA